MTTKRECTPFCHPSCIIKHHPLLTPLLNSRPTPGGVGTNETSCFSALEAAIQESEKDGSWNRDDNIPDEDPDYRFPLIHWASALGRVDIVRWLIAKKFSVMTVHKETGDTALNNALLSLQEIFREKDKPIKIFKELLKVMAGALTVRNNMGNSLLHICCHHLQEPRVEYFAECIHSILDFAKMRGSSFVANLVNLQNNEGNTPVHILAQEDRNCLILKSLIDTGKVDLGIRNSEMKTAYDVSIDSGQLKVFNYLKDMSAYAVRATSPVKQREYGKSIANSTRHSNNKNGTLLEVSSSSLSDGNNVQNVDTTVKPAQRKSPSSGKYVIKPFKPVTKNSQVKKDTNKNPGISEKSTVKDTSNNNKQKHKSSTKNRNPSAEMEKSTISTISTVSAEQFSNRLSQQLVPCVPSNTNLADLSPSKSTFPGLVAVPVHVHGNTKPLQQSIIHTLGNNMTVTLKGATKVYGAKPASDNMSSFNNLLNNNIMFHPLNSSVPSSPDPAALTNKMLLAVKPLSEQNNSGSLFSLTPNVPSSFSSAPSVSKNNLDVIYADSITNNPTVTGMVPVVTATSTESATPSITTGPSHFMAATHPHTTGNSDTTQEQNEVTSTVPPFPSEAVVRPETSQEAGNKHVDLTDSSADYRPPNKKSRTEGGSLAITNVVSLSSKTYSRTGKVSAAGDHCDEMLDVETTGHCNLSGSTQPTSSSITCPSDQQILSTSSKAHVLEKACGSRKPSGSLKLNGTSGSCGKKKTDSANGSGSSSSRRPNSRQAGNDSSSGSRSSSGSQANCDSSGTVGSDMSSSTETTSDSSGSGDSNICDRSKTAKDSKDSTESKGYGALLKYLSFCEKDTKIGILDALNKDKDRYIEDKKQLQEQVKVVKKEKSKLTADIKQKTSQVKSLLNELDKVQKELLHLSEIKKKNEKQSEDIKTELRTTDLKLKHLHGALAEFK